MNPTIHRAGTLALATIPAAILAAILSGCGAHASAPDPTGPNTQDVTNAKVVRMPPGFRNVVYGCDQYGNLVYVTSAGLDDSKPSAIFVLPHACPASGGGR